MLSCKSYTYKIFHNELQLNLVLQVNLQAASWSLSEDMVWNPELKSIDTHAVQL